MRQTAALTAGIITLADKRAPKCAFESVERCIPASKTPQPPFLFDLSGSFHPSLRINSHIRSALFFSPSSKTSIVRVVLNFNVTHQPVRLSVHHFYQSTYNDSMAFSQHIFIPLLTHQICQGNK